MFRYWLLEAPRGVDMSSNQISSITIFGDYVVIVFIVIVFIYFH